MARLLAAYTVVGLALGTLLGAGLWVTGVRRRAVFWGSALGCLVVDALLVLGAYSLLLPLLALDKHSALVATCITTVPGLVVGTLLLLVT